MKTVFRQFFPAQRNRRYPRCLRQQSQNRRGEGRTVRVKVAEVEYTTSPTDRSQRHDRIRQGSAPLVQDRRHHRRVARRRRRSRQQGPVARASQPHRDRRAGRTGPQRFLKKPNATSSA